MKEVYPALIKFFLIILLIAIILRAIYIFIYPTRDNIGVKNREDAIANDVWLGDYIPSKKVMFSRAGLEIPLANAYLYQKRKQVKTWYLTIKHIKQDKFQVLRLKALHDSLIGYKSQKRLHLTNDKTKKAFLNQASDRDEDGEMVYTPHYMFYYFLEIEEIPDTIMIYLIERRRESSYLFYHTPSDSVAYVRVYK